MRLRVNGVEHDVETDGSEMLAGVLREGLGLTGTKIGCGVGECGACTVLVDSRPVLSCVLPAAVAEGVAVETVEGLARTDPAVGEVVADLGASQCGFCTPGQIATIVGLLRSGRAHDRAAVRHGLAGNICRCTGYAALVDAAVALIAEEESHGRR